VQWANIRNHEHMKGMFLALPRHVDGGREFAQAGKVRTYIRSLSQMMPMSCNAVICFNAVRCRMPG